jgi:hypothetical protein
MFVFRRITATDVTAGHAEAEVDPAVSDAQTVLAALSARADVLDVLEVKAAHGHSAEREGWQTRKWYAERALACLLRSVANSIV